MFTLRTQNMRFRSCILTWGCVLLLILTASNPSIAEDTTTPPAEGNQNKTEQTTENPQTDADESTQRILPDVPPKIDEFYNYYEPLDDNNNYKPEIVYEWKCVKEAYDVKDIKFLRYLCIKLHELAGWGHVNVINNFIMDRAVIKYKNPMYFPTDTDFLQYVIEPPQDLGNNRKEDHFFITDGLKEDCVFYLIPTSNKLTAFELDIHICGINRALKGMTNATTQSPAAVAEVDAAV